MSALLGIAVSATAQTPEPIAPSVTSKQTPDAQAQPSASLTREDLTAWLDGFVPLALKRGDLAGAVVVVVKDGAVLVKKGYGYADVAARKPMDPDRALVRPGSTSKLFTWTAVMQLVEQDKLDLDRDVNAYLDFKISSRFDRPITMRHLMTHRAGFEEGLKSILVIDPERLQSTEEFLKGNQRPILFRPGEVPAYSNYGTALAGYIVQRIAGEPFEQYIERHIFSPLGMMHSTFRQPLPSELEADMAKGYMTSSAPPHPFELLATGPAGSLSSTAADMAQFMIAHLQEGRLGEQRILKPETARLMHTAAVPRQFDFPTIAHGFFEEDRNGRRIIGHGGDSIVFHTDLHLFLDEGVGLFFSFNSRGAEDSNYATRSALFEGFVDRYFPAPPVSPSAFAPVAEHAQLAAGRYWSSRRVDSAFINMFYLLGQEVITADADGSLNVPTFPEGESKPYEEIAPFVWRERNGHRMVALSGLGDSRTLISSEDPTSVLQPVPGWRSAAWNLWVLVGSILLLLWAAIQWPVSALRARLRAAPDGISGQQSRTYTWTRIGVLLSIAYVSGWIAVLMPILSNSLDVYDKPLDPYLWLLQLCGVLVLAAACVGAWNAWTALRGTLSWRSKAWHVLLALALIGMVWISIAFKLLTFDLGY